MLILDLYLILCHKCTSPYSSLFGFVGWCEGDLKPWFIHLPHGVCFIYSIFPERCTSPQMGWFRGSCFGTYIGACGRFRAFILSQYLSQYIYLSTRQPTAFWVICGLHILHVNITLFPTFIPDIYGSCACAGQTPWRHGDRETSSRQWGNTTLNNIRTFLT